MDSRCRHGGAGGGVRRWLWRAGVRSAAARSVHEGDVLLLLLWLVVLLVLLKKVLLLMLMVVTM
jgi:hypothetical protein